MANKITADELEVIKKKLRAQDVITSDEIEKVRERFVSGMKVRNTISNNIGVLRARSDDSNKLDVSSVWALPVDRKYTKGRHVGKKHETYWSILNIEII